MDTVTSSDALVGLVTNMGCHWRPVWRRQSQATTRSIAISRFAKGQIKPSNKIPRNFYFLWSQSIHICKTVVFTLCYTTTHPQGSSTKKDAPKKDAECRMPFLFLIITSHKSSMYMNYAPVFECLLLLCILRALLVLKKITVIHKWSLVLCFLKMSQVL